MIDDEYDYRLGAVFVHVYFDNGTEIIAPMLFKGDFDEYLKKNIIIGRNFPILDPIGKTDEDDEWEIYFDSIESNECASIQEKHISLIEYAEDEEIDFWFEMTDKNDNWINDRLLEIDEKLDLSYIERIDGKKFIIH